MGTERESVPVASDRAFMVGRIHHRLSHPGAPHAAQVAGTPVPYRRLGVLPLPWLPSTKVGWAKRYQVRVMLVTIGVKDFRQTFLPDRSTPAYPRETVGGQGVVKQRFPCCALLLPGGQ